MANKTHVINHNSVYFEEDDFFVKHVPKIADELEKRASFASNSRVEAHKASPKDEFNAIDFIENQIQCDDPDDPEQSRLNMAMANTEAFADLLSPMPPPRSLLQNKRKSIELGTPDGPIASGQNKRKSIFRTPAPDSPIAPQSDIMEQDYVLEEDFFKTQFLKQVDSLSIESFQRNHHAELIGLSQFFGSTQTQNDHKPISNAQCSKAPLGLTQILNDDEGFLDQAEDVNISAATNCPRLSNITNLNRSDTLTFKKPSTAATNSHPTDDINFDDMPQSSQLFLHDVRQVDNTVADDAAAAPPPAFIEPVTVYTSVKNATSYIELQRQMLEENVANLNDDNFLDAELSQAYRSTQYRLELEEVFDNCEKSICKSKPGEDTHEVNVASHLAGLDNLNWTQNDMVAKTPRKPTSTHLGGDKTPLFSASTFVRQRLEDMKSKSVSPKVVSRSAVSSFQGLGPFFGLPLLVKSLIKDYKGIAELYDWQIECLSLPAIARRNNLIYALPTSGGKTLVSEILILREILCRRKNCLFILPFVSIVQEKLWAMAPFAVQLDFLLEEYAAGKGALPPKRRRKKRSIYVATIEKALALVDSLIEHGRANELGLIVVDELHIIGEAGRGAALETLLTKAMFVQAGIQIVGMSATIGNLPELAKFLRADVYTRDFRPVELREYIKCGRDLLQIKSNGGPKTGELLADTFRYERSVEFNYRDDVERRDPDHLAGLISEVIPEESVLVFCPSKLNCENVAKLLSQLLPAKYCDYKRVQREELKQFMQKDGPICPTLARTLPYGIAYHHSGLTSEERRHLEDAFRTNIICVICCTSTLAAGVNLPAKRVILRSPYVGRDFITLSRYKQMVGRAGRAGLCAGDVGESILICSPKDNVRVGRLLCSAMDDAASSLHESSAKGIETMILSAIGLRLAVTRNELVALVDTTLMAVQADRLRINTKELTNRVLSKLFRAKTLSIKSSAAATTPFSPNVSLDVDCTSQEHARSQLEATTSTTGGGRSKINIRLKPSTQMEISSMGRASFKSAFDMAKANVVYKDLVQAQQALVVSNYLHMLYVITPYEPSEVNVTPTGSVYYAQYMRLDKDQLQVANVVGLTEMVAMRMMTGKPIKPPSLERCVNRFFFTLILQDLWNQRTVYEVAETFRVNRGIVQNLVVASASYACGVLKFCEELDEFWAFQELLRVVNKRLSYCCTVELIPLMDLPCVKLARAKQLYNAGYKTLESIAKADVAKLSDDIDNMSLRLAKQLVSSAKVLLLEKVETLREEVQDCLEVLEGKPMPCTPK